MSDQADLDLRPKLIGARIKRTEDPRLLTGLGSFVDDRQVAGVLHVAFCRSDHAHARIGAIDTAAAQAAPGVAAVFTGADFEKTVKPLRATLDTGILPKNTWNADALTKSLDEVRRIEARGAMIICGHDAAQWDTLRKDEDAYE